MPKKNEAVLAIEAGAAKRMTEAIRAEPQLFSELLKIAGLDVPRNAHPDLYRAVDRWLQRNRKAGLMTPMRDGRRHFWTITPAGHAKLNAGETFR